MIMESDKGRKINQTVNGISLKSTSLHSSHQKMAILAGEKICMKFSNSGSLFSEWYIHPSLNYPLHPDLPLTLLCLQLTKSWISTSVLLGVTYSLFRCVNIFNQVSVKFCLPYNFFCL